MLLSPLARHCLVALCLLATAPAARAADTDEARLDEFRNRSLTEKLGTPRRTIETLCFAKVAYDRFPTMIADMVACLAIDDKDGYPADTPGLLALALEEILDELSFPFEGMPGGSDGRPVTFYEDKEIKLVLARGADGLWRFDRETVRRIPAMRKTMAARTKQLNTVRAQLRTGMEEPTATMTTFLEKAVAGDFVAAAARLDLSSLAPEQRQERGPLLAWKLACLIQRRGFVYRQSIPVDPDGPPYTWSADRHGRIMVERVHQPGAPDSWLFPRVTVEAIDTLWQHAEDKPPDPRYLLLKAVVPPPPDQLIVKPEIPTAAPPTVPPRFASPRAMLREFFRISDDAEYDDAKLLEARQFLDLSHMSTADADLLGGKLAIHLDTVLRKLRPDLSTIPDKWSAAEQVLAGPGGLRVEIVRLPDGCWRFSSDTVARLPAMYESISGKERAEGERTHGLGNPRETLSTFFRAVNGRDGVEASRCLDLSELPASARSNLGPVLAFKLKAMIDRSGRIYLQEIPNDPDGPRQVLYRGPLGRIVLARREDDPTKAWQFTAGTVRHIETMFESTLDQPIDPSLTASSQIRLEPDFGEEPGIWWRMRMPPALRRPVLGLQLYQWLGLALVPVGAALAAFVVGWLALPLLCWFLRFGKDEADRALIRRRLGALRLLVFLLILHHLFSWLDLHSSVAAKMYSIHKLLVTAALVWTAFQAVDLGYLYYQRSGRLEHRRGLGDLVAPFMTRITKLAVLLSAVTYLVFEFGEGDSLKQFLTGLGIAGLAVSLAAQDSLKNFFATMVLIGDRSFRVGDRLVVGDKEGVVEQLGFRSTKLRTAEDSLLVLPNSTLAFGVIDNLGMRQYRRIRTSFTVPVATPLDRLANLRDQLRSYLTAHAGVDQNRTDVHIHGITDVGIEIEIVTYFEAPSGEAEKGFRDELTCEIVRLAQSLDVELATSNKQ